MKKLIHLIAAARPNFMKIAPLYHELVKNGWAQTEIVHTGQHYDQNMSDNIFRDLTLPKPHIQLGIGSGSHAEQTGKVMIEYEKIVYQKKPDMVVVVGDVNSTIACALAVSKVSYPVDNGINRPIIAHLEAGLRSFDRTMPEEINRLATDVISDILWTPSSDADENLKREGISDEKIIRVGNIMIDSLEMLRSRIDQEKLIDDLGLFDKSFAVVTLHRPSNVDNPQKLAELCQMLLRASDIVDLVFPVHPRTRKNLEQSNLYSSLDSKKSIHLLDPLNYISFMSLVINSKLVITDSGGIQEETTYLGIPCLTLRDNTERPITITEGTNKLCKHDQIIDLIQLSLKKDSSAMKKPDLWDGKTASRVVESIHSALIN